MVYKKCLVCNGDLSLALDLGKMPSANKLVNNPDEKVSEYPLKYYICNKCSLFQLTEFVNDRELFGDYVYTTGSSKMLVKHFRQMSKELTEMVNSNEIAFVIGSNDYTECELLKEAGFKTVYGVEPSNIGKNNPYTINEFFNYELSEELSTKIGKADLVTANNVFAHIPDPKNFLSGMANLIKDNGLISIEVHSLMSIINRLEIETLYAEHYYVWSVRSLHMLTQQLGLSIVDVIFMPEQHGGSLRFLIKKRGKENLKLMENKTEIKKLTDTLQKRADERRINFIKFIKELKSNGKEIGIWSVPAKVPTLLNFCGLSNKEISCAYEVAQTKIGKWIPKVNIEIKDEKFILQDLPDFLIIGAWNYWNQAKEVLKEYLNRGGHIINPLTLEVI